MQDSILYKSDGYKYTHWNMVPEGTTRIRSYLESRGGMFKGTTFFGLQGLMKEHLVGKVLDPDEIVKAAVFFKDYFGGRELFHEGGWMDMYEQHGGVLPISIRAVPEGTTVPTNNVLMAMENTSDDFPWLTNFLESLDLQVWYPTTVCTLDREIKILLLSYLKASGASDATIAFMLNDFGFRGATCVEAAQIGGAAHRVNFAGSDNIQGIRYAQMMYNALVGPSSIAATEHSVMTIKGRHGEADQLDRLLDNNPTGMIACVIDSYSAMDFLDTIVAARRERILARDGVFIARPDSGDPADMSVAVLERLGKVFGYHTNKAGYKVLPPQVRMIYGDGINYYTIGIICEAVMKAGWSVENMCFGMGGALLQIVNRDTQEMATKVCEATIDGVAHDVYKDPDTDTKKRSKRGHLKLVKKMGEHGQYHSTVRYSEEGEDQLIEVLRDGELLVDQDFADIQERARIAA